MNNMRYLLVLDKNNLVPTTLYTTDGDNIIQIKYIIISEHNNEIDANNALEQYKYNKYIDSIIQTLG